MILCIGDIHLSRNRLPLCKQVLKWLHEVTLEKKPDLIVFLGDIYDHHNTLHVEAQGEFVQHIKTMSALAPVVLIRGNHDNFKPTDHRYHSLQAFETWKRVMVVSEPIELDHIRFIPFLSDPSTYKDGPGLTFTHNTIIGADFGFVSADKGIHSEQIASDLVVSGHVHKRQHLLDGKVVYTGTPYAWSANDLDQTKHIMLIDEGSLAMEWIPSPFPIWRSLEYSIASDSELILNDKDMYIVTVTGTKAEVKALLSSAVFKKAIEHKHVQIRTNFIDKIKVFEKDIKSATMESTVSKYVNEVYKGLVDKALLEKEILRYLEQ